MKRNFIINGALGLLLAGTLGSCASDYLDTPPLSSVTDAAVGQTTENLAKAVNGIAFLMNYPKNGEQNGYPCGNVGEGYIMTFFGDAMGQDYYSYHFGMFESGSLIKMERFDNALYYTSTDPWGFYYAMIRMANAVLEKVDAAEESVEGERDLIKAEALAYRSHAYIRLLQLFAPRWSDSNNGERYCIVLRLKQSAEDAPLAKMNDVLNQIYSDLDEAIALFDQPEVDALSRPNEAVPDLAVAHGLYARAALLKNDWATAETHAAAARAGKNIMTADEWRGGFMLATDDYLWTNSVVDDDQLSNASWGSRNACNGEFQIRNQIGNGNINVDLFNQLDENDIRRQCFVMPSNIPAQPLTRWYSETYVDPLTMAVYKVSQRAWALAIYTYCVNQTPTASNGAAVSPAYTDYTGNNLNPFILFGSQLKFYCFGESKQANQYPYMRATEMLLTQAEACYMQGKTSEAQSIISELMSKRITGFTSCTKTGQDLLDEIRLQRRIELWGEGTTWFDLKRWSLNNTRRAWVAGDTTSGNIPNTYAMDVAPDQANRWVLAVPYVEYEYNKLIDRSLLAW